jgi:two-component system response regulator (stage 0 sporulation protein F)
MPKTKILVVDDEVDICDVTKNFLNRKGYEVATATGKDEAIEAVRQNTPAIILLDIRLKESSGIDVLKEIKKFNKDIKVIMVTALDDEENMKQAKAWGADDYIAKPFTASYLNDVLMQKLTTMALKEKKG